MDAAVELRILHVSFRSDRFFLNPFNPSLHHLHCHLLTDSVSLICDDRPEHRRDANPSTCTSAVHLGNKISGLWEHSENGIFKRNTSSHGQLEEPSAAAVPSRWETSCLSVFIQNIFPQCLSLTRHVHASVHSGIGWAWN